MRSGLFLMKFEALGFVVKHDFAYLVNLLNRNPNQGENGEIKSLLITISETQPWSYFPLFKRDELVMSLRTSIKTYGHKFVHLYVAAILSNMYVAGDYIVSHAH